MFKSKSTTFCSYEQTFCFRRILNIILCKIMCGITVLVIHLSKEWGKSELKLMAQFPVENIYC